MELHYEAAKAVRGISDEDTLPDGSKKEPLVPLSRAARERVPERMVHNLMRHYIDTINDDTQLNPIRDGIPQCRNHPFEKGSRNKIGCIHSCAKKDANLVLPVVRDYTLGDVMTWVKALVLYSVNTQEARMGYRRPTDLTR